MTTTTIDNNALSVFPTQQSMFDSQSDEQSSSDSIPFFYSCDIAGRKGKSFGFTKNFNSFYTIYSSLEVKNFYELVKEDIPRYEYYDIDYVIDEDNFLSAERIFLQFNSIRNEFIDHAGFDLPATQWRITDSSVIGKKVSIHLVNRSTIWTDAENTKAWYHAFDEYLKEYYPEWRKKLFDICVCSRNRSMRMIGSSKLGQNRPLRKAYWHAVSKNAPDSEFFIQITDELNEDLVCDVLGVLTKSHDDDEDEDEPVIPNEDCTATYSDIHDLLDMLHDLVQKDKFHSIKADITDDGIQYSEYIKIAYIVRQYLNDEEFKTIFPMITRLYRNRASVDGIDKQWTGFSVDNSYDGKKSTIRTLHFYCRYHPEYKTRFPQPEKVEIPFKDTLDKYIKWAYSHPKSFLKSNINTVDSDKYIPEVIEHESEFIDPYELDKDTVFVRAMYGMGKTYQTVKNEEIHMDSKSLYIAVMRSLLTEVSNVQYSTGGKIFKKYDEIEGSFNFKKDRKICSTIESIIRLNPKDGPPDILYLDEYASIKKTLLTSSTIKNKRDTWTKFLWAVQYAKKLIVLDADLDLKSCHQLAILRKDTNAVFHSYTKKGGKPQKVIMTNNEENWRNRLFKYALEGKKIAVASTSTNELQNLERIFDTMFPDKEILSIWRETDVDFKDEIFSDVNEHISQYDIFLYSPTAKVGISFEKLHFDYVFCYHHHMTEMSSEDVGQLIRRVRQTTTNETYVFAKIVKHTTPTTIKEIEKQISAIDFYGHYVYNANGGIEPLKDLYYDSYIENKIKSNLSYNNFVKQFTLTMIQKGITVEAWDDEDDSCFLDHVNKIDKVDVAVLRKTIDNENKDLSKEVKDEKLMKRVMNALTKDRKDGIREDIANAKILTEKEKDEIKEMLDAGIQVLKEDMHSLKKTNIAESYNINPDNINADVIKIVEKATFKKAFNNLTMIKDQGGDVSNISSFITENMSKYMDELKERGEAEEEFMKSKVWLHRDKTLDRMLIAINMLQQLGIDNIYDKKVLFENADDGIEFFKKCGYTKYLQDNWEYLEHMKNRRSQSKKSVYDWNMEAHSKYMNSWLIELGLKLEAISRSKKTRKDFAITINKAINCNGTDVSFAPPTKKKKTTKTK